MRERENREKGGEKVEEREKTRKMTCQKKIEKKKKKKREWVGERMQIVAWDSCKEREKAKKKVKVKDEERKKTIQQHKNHFHQNEIQSQKASKKSQKTLPQNKRPFSKGRVGGRVDVKEKNVSNFLLLWK